jgi:hypothetical protein
MTPKVAFLARDDTKAAVIADELGVIDLFGDVR